MSLPSRDRFERLLRGLSADGFAAFVADLWAARGFETSIEDGVVVATRAEPARERRVLLPRHTAPRFGGLRSADPPADVTDLVASGPASPRLRADAAAMDADLVAAADLYDAVRYAVSDAARDELFRTHFGRPAAAFAPTGAAPRGGVGRVRSRLDRLAGALSGMDRSRALAAVGVVLLLVAVLLSVPPELAGTGSVGAPGTPTDGDRGIGGPAASTSPGPTTAPDRPEARAGGLDPQLDGRPWPMFRGDPTHAGARPAPTLPRAPPSVAARIDLDGPVLSSPAVVGDSIYAASGAGVHAIATGSGVHRWRFAEDRRVRSSPAVANGTVYVGLPAAEDGDGPEGLVALRARDGAVRFVAPVGPVPHASPTVANGTVYVGSARGVYAVSASTGAVRWGFETGRPVSSSPAVSGDTVYVGIGTQLYALSAATGRIRWTYGTAGAVSSSPAVANGTVYVGSAGGGVHAVDAGTGERRWRFATGGAVSSSPAVANGTVYVGSTDGSLYALAAANGTPRWRYGTDGTVRSSPAVEGRLVYVGSTDGRLYAVQAGTGALAWRVGTNGGISSSPAVSNGLVLVGSEDGRLYVVRARLSLGFEGVPIGSG